MNFQTGEQRRLTSFVAFFPTWSPDGAKIACSRSGPQDIVGIWIVDFRDTSAVRFGFGGDPHWSPRGDEFVYSAQPDPHTAPQVTIVNIRDMSRKRLTQNDHDNRNPRWSSTRLMITWFLYIRTKGEAWIMNSDGSEQRKLIDGSYPSFSPDSQTIVFSAFDPTRTKIVLWRIALNGSGLRQLTQ